MPEFGGEAKRSLVMLWIVNWTGHVPLSFSTSLTKVSKTEMAQNIRNGNISVNLKLIHFFLLIHFYVRF